MASLVTTSARSKVGAGSLQERLLDQDADAACMTHGDDDMSRASPDVVLVNIEKTFRYMTERRLQRRYRGIYMQYSFVAQIGTWIVVLYTLLVLASVSLRAKLSTISSDEDTTDDAFSSTDVIYMAAIAIMVYAIVQVALIVRWLVYWVVIAATTGCIVTGRLESILWLTSTTLSPTESADRRVVIALLIVVELLTVLTYCFVHFGYPWLVRRDQFNALKWWQVRREPGRGNAFSFRSSMRFYTRKRNMIKYSGGLDREHRPHGYGIWTDSTFHGERLIGLWHHGIPIAPYRSFERGSGYGFVNLRVAYCHNRAEARTDQVLFLPKHSSDGLHWGVASVECSVSGGFFKFLPLVKHLTPVDGEGALQTAAECLLVMQTPADAVVFQDPSKSNPRASLAYDSKPSKSAKRMLFQERSWPVFDTEEPAPEHEALILLHGYNCSLDYGMKRMAQLVSLGDFPSSIHPYVFSWPTGQELAYFPARNVGCESERTSNDFSLFVRGLVEAGYKSINIIAHSIGVRIFFSCLNRGLLDDLFVHLDEDKPKDDTTPRARLSTLTMANPDYPRDEFVARGGGFDRARRLCDCITLYVDRMDGALFYSETIAKEAFLAPLAYSLGRRPDMVYRDDTDEENHGDCECAEPDPEVDPEAGDLLGRLGYSFRSVDLDRAVREVNEQGMFDGVALNTCRRRHTGISASASDWGDAIDHKRTPRSRLEYLDVDVIDTTWMDHNVHAIRHNYFNINPTLVEDLRRLIVHKRRAHSRPGLMKNSSADNVFIFLVAPAHIKNK